MKRMLLYCSFTLLVWMLFAQCFIMRNRISDKKAYRIFAHKNTSLKIYDTLINDRHVHYAVSGCDSLPTLVFIHGSPGSWMNYMMYMYNHALQQKFRMVSIDRPGFGYSNFGKALSLQAQCKLMLPVLQSLQTEMPMYVCGHSMGAPVVVQLAAESPTLFTTAVIVAGSIDVQQEKKETWRTIMKNKPLYWLLPGAFGPSNTELLYLKKDLLPLQNQFSKIICKVQFVHGSKDTWVPIANMAYGKKMLVNAKSVSTDTIVNADHQIPWKNKDALTEILLRLY